MGNIEKIKVEPYKRHQGEGDQVSYKGVGLTPIEQELVRVVNELIQSKKPKRKDDAPKLNTSAYFESHHQSS